MPVQQRPIRSTIYSACAQTHTWELMVYCIEWSLTLEYMTNKATILIIISFFSVGILRILFLKEVCLKALCNFRMKIGNAKCSVETETCCLQWCGSHILLDHGGKSAGFSLHLMLPLYHLPPTWYFTTVVWHRCTMLYKNYWKWPSSALRHLGASFPQFSGKMSVRMICHTQHTTSLLFMAFVAWQRFSFLRLPSRLI